MRKNSKLLLLSLMACTVLTGCDDDTKVQNGENPIATVSAVDKEGNATSLDTVKSLQDLYLSLKDSAGGSTALDALLEKICYLEYYQNGSFSPVVSGSDFSVKQYHTAATFKADIEEHFTDIFDAHSYEDEDGVFDKNEYKEYVEDSLNYEIDETKPVSTKYLSTEVATKLGYDYDEYIEEELIPDILLDYVYRDYVTSSSKYEGQFSNQYAVELEVLKIPYDTTKLNSAWNEAFVKDVKAVTGKTDLSTYSFGTDYSFVTFNSNKDLIVFETTATGLNYSVYKNDTTVDGYYNKMFKPATSGASIKQLKFADVDVTGLTKDTEKSFVINASSTADDTFYKQVEQVLIARDSWKIDHEVVLAANYDYKTPWYNSMTETEKSEAESFSSTYSSSNSKPLKDVVKSKKISAQQKKYFTESDYYTKNNYTNVLPTSLSSLRGTTAKELLNNLHDMKDGTGKFLLPAKDTYNDPVYFDESDNNYYICEVDSYYGFYKATSASYTAQTASKSIPNYQIGCYQDGVLAAWKIEDGASVYTRDSANDVTYSESTVEAFADTINLVRVTCDQILTSAMKKEAIVALFKSYNLEINDQDVYDYISGQYPDYFDTDD